MFEQSMFESDKRTKTKRGAATFLSFILQAVVIGILVLMPLVFTQALPLNISTVTTLVAPPPPPPPPPPPAAKVAMETHAQPHPSAVTETRQLTEPIKIPDKIAMIREAPEASAPPPPGGAIGGVLGGVPGGVPGGQVGGVLGGVLGGVPNAVPEIAAPKKVRVSQGVSRGLLIHKVTPEYPPLARMARVQGAVVLQAEIGKDGRIKNLQVVSGHPLLDQAALQAVEHWRYKPYYLNGQPMEVETLVTVNFNLAS